MSQGSVNNLKKVAVFTGTRAEYGLLYWLMKGIQETDSLKLQLLVSGTHLSKEHGYTLEQIIADGFHVDAEIDLHLTDQDGRIDVARAMSKATAGVAEVLQSLAPDMLILLGDRYELLGAASAALVMGVPIFHLHGGEVTEGAYDDAIRHAVTKMATWHGVANEEYRQRVIQMGEPAGNVFTVGAMGLDNIRRLELLSKPELEQELDFQFGEITVLVTFHPVTMADNPIEGFTELLAVLSEREDIRIIFTHPNADHGRAKIVELIDEFVQQFPRRSMVKDSLGQRRFLSALKYVDAVLGNSSSGIIEAPSMQVPSLNIGDRQKGRHKAASVVDCHFDQNSIQQGLADTLSYQPLKDDENPYAQGNPTESLIKIIQSIV